MDKPVLSNSAFKFVNMDEIDCEKGLLNIIERIIYKGTQDDLAELFRYYGKKRLGEEIINTKCFGPKEVNFCCLLFKVKESDFKYYKKGAFRAYPEYKDCPDDLVYEHFA